RRRGGRPHVERACARARLRRPAGGHALVDRVGTLRGRPARGRLEDSASQQAEREPAAPGGAARAAVGSPRASVSVSAFAYGRIVVAEPETRIGPWISTS